MMDEKMATFANILLVSLLQEYSFSSFVNEKSVVIFRPAAASVESEKTGRDEERTRDQKERRDAAQRVHRGRFRRELVANRRPEHFTEVTDQRLRYAGPHF